MTIVKAVKELERMGLVVRRAGSGTYATSRTALENHLLGLLILYPAVDSPKSSETIDW
jgi:DNA-binding GntR family transcriptional regulator